MTNCRPVLSVAGSMRSCTLNSRNITPSNVQRHHRATGRRYRVWGHRHRGYAGGHEPFGAIRTGQGRLPTERGHDTQRSAQPMVSSALRCSHSDRGAAAPASAASGWGSGSETVSAPLIS